MKVYDLSVVLSNGMPIWPGDPGFVLRKALDLEKDGANCTELQMGAHTGTNVDVPLAYIKEGHDLTQFPLDRFVGWANIVGINKKAGENISGDDFKNIDLEKNSILIISTGWEANYGTSSYFRNYPYLTEDAADILVESGVKAVGTDTPTPDPPEGEHPVHRKLLGANIGIIENLTNIRVLRGKRIFFIALPLKIKGGEASPVRAVAISF